MAYPDDENVPENEGVRLIGADEAAEALEREDVARRRPGDALRFGDRPPSPDPAGPRPTIRFPLSPEDRALHATPAPAASRDPYGDPDPYASPEAPTPAADPWADPAPWTASADEHAGRAADDPDPYAPLDDDTALPHWTEPATGEVPRIFAGDGGDEGSWSSYGSQPRWRGEGSAYDDDSDDFSRLADPDSRLGALDDRDRDPDELYRFEDPDPATRSFFGEPDPYVDPEAAGEHLDDDLAGVAWEPEPEPVAVGARTRTRPAPAEAARPASDGGSGGRDVPIAVAVGVGLVALFFVALSIGPGAVVGVVTIVLGLAAAELFSVLRQAGYQPATLLGLAATVTLPLAAYWRGEAAFPLVLFLTVAFGLVWYLSGAGGRDRPVLGLSSTLLGVGYVGLLGAHAALLLAVPVAGTGLLTGAVLAAVGYDIGGFVVGRNAGSRPLSAISPNKTVEGLVGGMFGAVLFVVVPCVLLPGISPWDSFGDALLLGLVAAVVAPLGDLCESLLKRDLDVKDMGGLLPGHGGVLDRFDSMLFVLPATYYLSRVLFF